MATHDWVKHNITSQCSRVHCPRGSHLASCMAHSCPILPELQRASLTVSDALDLHALPWESGRVWVVLPHPPVSESETQRSLVWSPDDSGQRTFLEAAVRWKTQEALVKFRIGHTRYCFTRNPHRVSLSAMRQVTFTGTGDAQAGPNMCVLNSGVPWCASALISYTALNMKSRITLVTSPHAISV
jgi:hypothetical protein